MLEDSSSTTRVLRPSASATLSRTCMCAAADPVLDGYAHTAAFFGDMPRLEELFDKHQGTFCKLGPHQWTPMVRSAAALQTVAWARFVYGGGAAVWWTDGGGAGGEGGGGVVDDRARVRRRGARRLSEDSRSGGSCRASSPLLRTAGLSEASAEPLLLPCPTFVPHSALRRQAWPHPRDAPAGAEGRRPGPHG